MFPELKRIERMAVSAVIALHLIVGELAVIIGILS